MNAQYYKTQSYYFKLIKLLLLALSVDNPARVRVESILLTCNEETDLQPLYRQLLQLIAEHHSTEVISRHGD